MYKLVNRQPIPIADAQADWSEAARRVAFTRIGGVHISTVFLVFDHAFPAGPPLLFETMVFGGPLDGEQDRYSTWDEAERGHEAMCQRVRESVEMDYREYAIQHLKIACEKDEDAPASAQMHEEQAAYALLVGRVPKSGEVLDYLRDLGLGTCNCRHENPGYKFYPHNPWCQQSAEHRTVGDGAAPPPLTTNHEQAKALLQTWQAEDRDAPATEPPQPPRVRCGETDAHE